MYINKKKMEHYGQTCITVVLTVVGALLFIAAIGGIVFLSLLIQGNY